MICNKKSFSIIELLIVIVAAVILFKITIPKMFFLKKYVLQSEVDKLFTVFSYLQQKAITSNKKQKIIFDLNQNGYSYNSKFYKFANVVNYGFLKYVKGPPSSPSKMIKKAVSFKRKGENETCAIFYTDGKVTPGTVYLIDNEKNFMMAITCPISQVSCIRKYSYNNKNWLCLK